MPPNERLRRRGHGVLLLLAAALGTGLLVAPAAAGPSPADLRAATLTDGDLPQYQLAEMGRAEMHRWSWCGKTIDHPYAAGVEAVFEGRIDRRLTEGLYSYRSRQVARTWFAKQKRLAGSCTRFSAGQERYSRIRAVDSPTLRGARQVYAQRFTIHVPDSGWRVHVLKVSVRRVDWTQTVTLTEAQPPARTRAMKAVRVAYHKAVVHL